jgi:hypothetical protein
VGDGIYADEFGLSATVKVHGKQREQRFPRGTSLAFIAAWRQQTRDDLEDDTASPAPTLGTFRDDVTRYLPTITTRRAFKADRSHLRAWLPALGDMMRAKIRAKHVRVAVTTWHHPPSRPRPPRALSRARRAARADPHHRRHPADTTSAASGGRAVDDDSEGGDKP